MPRSTTKRHSGAVTSALQTARNTMDRTLIASRLDPAAWVDSHGDYLYRFALARVRDPDSAEELVQQSFFAALVARHRFRGLSSERTWLTAILKRKVADLLRTTVRRAARQEQQSDGTTDALFTRSGSWKKKPGEWSVDDPGRELTRGEFRETLAGCLDKLPDRHRRAFVLRHMDDESLDAVRIELGASSANLAVILHRARLRLWRCLNRNWFGEKTPANSGDRTP